MKRKYDRWDSAIKNNRTYDYYFYRLRDLAISRYKWHNLPDSVDERFLELCLFDKGMCVFFKDEVLNYLCLNVAISGQLNVYNLPTKRRAYATTGYNKNLNYDDSVIIFNNFSHTPSIADIHYFCDKLYLIDRTIDINTNAQHRAGKYFIAELDESDGTIVKYSPDILVINNLEEDHIDHYKNGMPDLVKTFNQEIAQSKKVLIRAKRCRLHGKKC